MDEYTELAFRFKNKIERLQHRDCKKPEDFAAFMSAITWKYFEAVLENVDNSEEEFINFITDDMKSYLHIL